MRHPAIPLTIVCILLIAGCSSGTTTVPTAIPSTGGVPPTATIPISSTQELVAVPPSGALPACPGPGKIRVGTDATYAPFESLVGGQMQGFDIDMLNALLSDLGYAPEYHNAIFDTIFTALARGQYDVVISASTITPDRQALISFGNPYFLTGQLVVIRKADQGTLTNLQSLSGKTASAEEGTTSAKTAAAIPGIRALKTYPNADQTLAHLSAGDSDFVVIDSVTALASVAAKPTLQLAVMPRERLTSEFYGIAVRKECTALLGALNRQLAAFVANGNYARLYTKYIGDAPPDEYLPGGQTPDLSTALNATSILSTNATVTPTGTATPPLPMQSTF